MCELTLFANSGITDTEQSPNKCADCNQSID